jgi:SAM-dependent methyltransferase
MRTDPVASASYAVLAAEYYDPNLHPTCASFRAASRTLLEQLIDLAAVDGGAICEVGAGSSLLAPLLADHHFPLGALLITDDSVEMLSHSQEWERAGATLNVASAYDLPVADGSLELVMASLADPYDIDELWQELRRVLAPNGRIVLTTPAWEWAARFRTSAGEIQEAWFTSSTGELIAVPSYVRPPAEEATMIESHALRVERTAVVTLGELENPAPKLGVVEDTDPVLRAYAVRHAGDSLLRAQF